VSAAGLAIRGAEVDGAVVDVLVQEGRVAAIGAGLALQSGAEELSAQGGALLPGLVDHHVHLLATAAAACSVDAAQPGWRDRLRAETGAGWLRVVGASDELDRDALDALGLSRPVRVQHRSGALWTLNGHAIDELDTLIAARHRRPSVAALTSDERRTGQLWRADRRLRALLPPAAGLDLAALGRRLAELGITSVVDATPDLDEAALSLLRSAMPQRIDTLGACGVGARKVVVPDHALPSLADLAAAIGENHDAGRPVALHCVTRAALVLAVVALREAGVSPGDRIEHAAVCDDDMAGHLAELGVVVVTQPSLVRLRGDDYAAVCDPADRPWLWRYAGLLRAGVRVAVSSDAPYGDLDPWRTIATAVNRCTASGAVLGATEAVPADVALASMLSHSGDPGGPPRSVAVGADADLCLLDRPLAAAIADPGAVRPVLTLVGGVEAFRAG